MGWCWRRARRSRRRCPGATAGPPSMRLRTITEADLGRVLACTTDDPVGVIDPELLRRRFADGQGPTPLPWIAENRGQILARAVWWLAFGGAYPRALDCLLVDGSVSARASLAV